VIVRAEVGKWLVIRSSHMDVPARLGRIVEVSHPDGGPPYVVRWSGEDRTSVVFPGPDAVVMDNPPTTAVSPHPG
jgi:hypothetical protein